VEQREVTAVSVLPLLGGSALLFWMVLKMTHLLHLCSVNGTAAITIDGFECAF